jgi:hypothetical protein
VISNGSAATAFKIFKQNPFEAAHCEIDRWAGDVLICFI